MCLIRWTDPNPSNPRVVSCVGHVKEFPGMLIPEAIVPEWESVSYRKCAACVIPTVSHGQQRRRRATRQTALATGRTQAIRIPFFRRAFRPAEDIFYTITPFIGNKFPWLAEPLEHNNNWNIKKKIDSVFFYFLKKLYSRGMWPLSSWNSTIKYLSCIT